MLVLNYFCCIPKIATFYLVTKIKKKNEKQYDILRDSQIDRLSDNNISIINEKKIQMLKIFIFGEKL